MEHYKHTIEKIDSLQGYEANSRTHSKEQIEQIMKSMEKYGFTNPILIDEKKGIIAGHGRAEAALNLGYADAPCVTVTGLNKHDKAALVIADNKLAENAGWNYDALKAELGFLNDVDFDLSLTGFDVDELADLLDIVQIDSEFDDNPYSDNIEGMHYEPNGEKPSLELLCDTKKHNEILNKINSSNVPQELKLFLTAASYRHVKFNYQNIAEFYAHCSKEEQELFEHSALVIIDYDDALKNGYIKLSDGIAEQYKSEYKK